MMRRRHKKSRKGCLECKKRHIKCDETRPRCINCATVDRECQYSTSTTAPVDMAEGSASRSVSGGTSPQPPGLTVPGPAYFSASPSASPSAPYLTPLPIPFSAAPDPAYASPQPQPHAFNSKVDLAHMQLLHHYLTYHTDIYPFVQGDLHEIIVKMALYGSEKERPFLLHSLLALSARHLSSVSSLGHQGQQQSRYYHDLAIQMQTQALTLFNSFDVEYFAQSMERRVPAFMFSAIIGFHALCDMLSFRDDDFGMALNRFTEYLRLHRGIISVMDGYWEDLKRTELGIVYQMAVPNFIGGEGTGKECDDILRRLEGAGLAEEELGGVRRAVNALQYVFDAAPDYNRRIHVLCYWAVLIPPSMMTMIETGRREVLAILAYYFLALHYCKEAWFIGNAGEFLLRGLTRYLGPEWEAWLKMPMRMLSEALEAEETLPTLPILTNLTTFISSTMDAARNLTVERPSQDDAGRIAEIHIAAMNENPLLHAQCPTPHSISSLQRFLEKEVTGHIRGSDGGILVARDPGTGLIVGFVRWTSPSCPESVKLEESASGAHDIEGCRHEFFDGYVELAEKAKKRVMTASGLGETGCYHLSFVCIDPAYQGRGAGKMLSKAVLDFARADGLPVYLESTDVAVKMYEKLGFRKVDFFEMRIPTREGSEELEEVYEEVCMIWKPI
ncbi:hypothetical protein QBC38DRAFT_352077 [Podospora fimiseda]|uniref:Zn(2)-C6 fungal-type domain-containing protein n=1 Tax=Podospora fimiseda TaxID=252190 RepID=A0AAN7BZW7_9PEZI|nr:hypothetical protein QBC38DRAFT_352077 [Podospora fimiseda]